jgi:hypothetical protein
MKKVSFFVLALNSALIPTHMHAMSGQNKRTTPVIVAGVGVAALGYSLVRYFRHQPQTHPLPAATATAPASAYESGSTLRAALASEVPAVGSSDAADMARIVADAGIEQK